MKYCRPTYPISEESIPEVLIVCLLNEVEPARKAGVQGAGAVMGEMKSFSSLFSQITFREEKGSQECRLKISNVIESRLKIAPRVQGLHKVGTQQLTSDDAPGYAIKVMVEGVVVVRTGCC
jgi:hypothetical protein